MNTEEIRRQYLPQKINILLVGESPPKNGKFFYVKSAMTTYTSRPFERIFKTKFADNAEFLKFFCNSGCYLDDISHEPVDHLPQAERESKLNSKIPDLALRLKKWQPQVVCIALKKIKPQVLEAIKLSGINSTKYVLPFAGNGHQNKFMKNLEEILLKHLDTAI